MARVLVSSWSAVSLGKRELTKMVRKYNLLYVFHMFHCALTKQFSVEQNSNGTNIRGPGRETAVGYDLHGAYKQPLSPCPGSVSSLFLQFVGN